MSLKLILLLLWYVSGLVSFIYWWTKDHDFELLEIPMAISIGALGPIAFVLGASIHSSRRPPSIVIFKKRNNE